MRAREPDAEGYVDRDGVKLHFEVVGHGQPTLLLLSGGGITLVVAIGRARLAAKLERFARLSQRR